MPITQRVRSMTCKTIAVAVTVRPLRPSVCLVNKGPETPPPIFVQPRHIGHTLEECGMEEIIYRGWTLVR